jgi:hypothetical protein
MTHDRFTEIGEIEYIVYGLCKEEEPTQHLFIDKVEVRIFKL